MRRLALALLFLLAFATTVQAAPARPALDVTLVGATYTVTGSGFAPGPVPIQIGEPGCCRFFTVTADEHGEFSFTQTITDIGGTYRVMAYERNDRNGRLRLVASDTFEVP